MQNPFAETGAASSFVSLHEDIGAEFVGCESQLEMTPFQRQVIDAARNKEYEKQQERMPDMDGDLQRNARGGGAAGQSDGGTKETVRYINREEYPDHEVHDN